MSLEFLRGSEIDFRRPELIGAVDFKINNPNANSWRAVCGTNFSV